MTAAEPVGVLTLQMIRDLFASRQVHTDAALVMTLADLRALCVKAQRVVLDDIEQNLKASAPPICGRCRDLGVVPDWTNWDHYHGEPKPKPCPDCTKSGS